MIKFTPKPKNEFNEFMNLYFNLCRKRIPQIQGLAAKWSFEDLIPGLSDYDTRFIYRDGMNADDWCDASIAIGQVHLDICKKYPHWARILEHLPGINITWSEFLNPELYYPEYHQWTIYKSTDPGKLNEAKDFLKNQTWSEQDEYFCLKKFLLYYGPYDRKIDPPINLGDFESKYPIHSRLMHYFVPPVQAAMSILQKRMIRGKAEAIRQAKKAFPELKVFDELLEIVEKHYECPELYIEPHLSALEERLFDALKLIAKSLPKEISLVDIPENSEPEIWKSLVAHFQPPVFLQVFDNTKWARQMKGRLQFYVDAPDYFNSVLCLDIELNRICNLFCIAPYKAYWKLREKDSELEVPQIIENLRGDILTDKQYLATKEFFELTYRKWQKQEYIEVATKIIAIYEDFYRGLYQMTESLKKIIN